MTPQHTIVATVLTSSSSHLLFLGGLDDGLLQHHSKAGGQR